MHVKLEEIANGVRSVPLAVIGGDPTLARQLQTLLGAIGLLDPPVDGQFGPVSQWALAALLKRLGLSKTAVIDAAVARSLLEAAGVDPFPIRPRDTLAGRLVQALQAQHHWIQRHPECVNIVHLEGLDPNVA